MIHDSDDPPLRGISVSLSILLQYVCFHGTMWPDMTHLPVYSLPHSWNVSSKKVRHFIYSVPISLAPRTMSGTLLGFGVQQNLWNKLGDEGMSLVVQWLRVHLAMQGQGFDPWWWKIPYDKQQRSLGITTTETTLKPVVRNTRSYCNENTTHHNQE